MFTIIICNLKWIAISNANRMHEFCLESTHEVLGCTLNDEQTFTLGVLAVRKADERLVMLRILDFRQLSQARRTVMAARVKANLRYPGYRIAQIYSIQEYSDKSMILVELYLSTNKTFKCLLSDDVISINRAFKLIFELIYGTSEILDYYLQRNIALTPAILHNAILLPDMLFVSHDDTIVFPHPCITTTDAELGISNRLLKPEHWKRYAPPEVLLMSDTSMDLTIHVLEKSLVWSIGMLASDLYDCVNESDRRVSHLRSMHCDNHNTTIYTPVYVPLAIQTLIDMCLVEDAAARADCHTLIMNLESMQDVLDAPPDHSFESPVTYMNSSLISDEEGFLLLPEAYLYTEGPKLNPESTTVCKALDIYDVLDVCDYPDSLSDDYWEVKDETKMRRQSICCSKTLRSDASYINDTTIKNGHQRSKSEFWSKHSINSALERYIQAASAGYADIVAIYITRCSRQQDKDGITALIAATKAGRHECVSLLTQYEAGLQDAHGLSALMHAVIRNDVKSIQILRVLESRLVDNRGRTALMHAVEHDHYAVLYLLLEEVDIMGADHVSAYDIAVKLGHSRCITILEPYSLQLRALRVARINSYGYTALMFASIQNDVTTVKLLAPTEGGVVAEDGTTALHAAILHNNYLCMPPLLRYERSIVTNDGLTPLELAEKLNRYECIHILRGPAVKGYLPMGLESCLMTEARSGDPERLQAHLDDVCLMSAKGETALMIAAAEGNYRCVKDLLQYEQGMVSPDGWTALMYASMNGHSDCVSLLCIAEAKIINIDGQLAYDIALERGHKACARLLSKHEEYLTIAYRVDELLALDRMDDAIKLLKQPCVPSEALVKCIWNTRGGEFMALWGVLRANADLSILAKHITLEMSVDLNDPELTDLVLKREAKCVSINAERSTLEGLLHKAFLLQKFLVIPVICDYAMSAHLHIFVHKRVGKAIAKRTRLMIAAEAGDLSTVEQNLQYLCYQCKGLCTFQRKKENGSLDECNKTVSSITALMLAAANGHKTCIHALLPELGLRDQASGATALILAIWYGNPAIVRLLLPEAGIADSGGVTPLMHASKRNNKRCMQLIEMYLKTRRL